jgi:hypothetical protein
MLYWAGLFKSDLARGVAEGIKVPLAIAYKAKAQQRRTPEIKLLTAPQGDQGEMMRSRDSGDEPLMHDQASEKG